VPLPLLRSEVLQYIGEHLLSSSMREMYPIKMLDDCSLWGTMVKKMAAKTGNDLFIVDNSDED
jgi:hypothetical protein